MEMFIYETRQFLEELEQLALASEQSQSFSEDDVNEIFRAMHTIKGSAAMMMLDEISKLAHSVEDIFFYIREKHPQKVDTSTITDLVLNAVDFMRQETDELDGGGSANASSKELRDKTESFLREMKISNGDDPDEDLRKYKKSSSAQPSPSEEKKPQQYYISAKPEKKQSDNLHVYKAVLHFEEGCEMEEVRSYAVINNLKESTDELFYKPEKLLEDDHAAESIRKDGLQMWFTSELDYQTVEDALNTTIFMKELELKELESVSECEYWPSVQQQAVDAAETSAPIVPKVPQAEHKVKQPAHHEAQQMISVKVSKLDRLMDLVGELVIAEAMVTQNPDLNGLELHNFQKAARQLHKIDNELQDSVMSIRMVPLEGTFRKMNRIVRDMTKTLGKKARLVLQGEDTEVDKNIIEHIGDPLMHIVRNSMDHGIEMPEERAACGKQETGTVTISAENAGGEVVIRVSDDGAGIDKEKVLAKARENHLFTKPESELTDQEIYSFIFAPGFSTNKEVTQYSGRGVGMDVVVKNIEKLGGKVVVDSTPGEGSVTTLRIPLTLAIIEGMSLSVGDSTYTIPINSIKESFKPDIGSVFKDPDGSEMIMVRGECYPVVRLSHLYHKTDAIEDIDKGIMVLAESGQRIMGIFADKLIGVQEIVVKPIPKYIQEVSQSKGITGCTLLGDGSISLIIDAASLEKEIFL